MMIKSLIISFNILKYQGEISMFVEKDPKIYVFTVSEYKKVNFIITISIFDSD